jgi:F0F1-type ATP synthase membrane subunit b/b'
MAQIRYRLRTIMIIVAFVALVLVAVLQQYYLNRAQVQMEMYRAEAEHARATAEMQRLRAEQQLAAAQSLLEATRPEAKHAGEEARQALPRKDKRP